MPFIKYVSCNTPANFDISFRVSIGFTGFAEFCKGRVSTEGFGKFAKGLLY